MKWYYAITDGDGGDWTLTTYKNEASSSATKRNNTCQHNPSNCWMYESGCNRDEGSESFVIVSAYDKNGCDSNIMIACCDEPCSFSDEYNN